MKKFTIALTVMLAAAFSFSAPAFSQEDNNRDENGKIVRGPYEKAGADANWFVSLGAGFNWTADGILSGKLDNGFGPALDIMAGKWFCPTVGFRIGYQGLQSRVKGPFEGDDINNRLPFHYVHADFLWNFSNTVWGYRESRIYNLVPYAHIGDLTACNNGFAGGFGLLNNFRLGKHWSIYADVRGILTGGNHLISGNTGVGGNLSLTAGLTWNIGKNGWSRSSSADSSEADDAKAALEEAGKAVKEAEEAKAAEEPAEEPAEETKAAEEPVAEPAQEAEPEEQSGRKPNVFYFGIGQSLVSLDEAERVKDYAAKADKSKKYIVLGYADKNTGSLEFNESIAYKRALNVGFLLIKYGIPADNVKADIGGVITTDDIAESRIVVVNER